MIRECRSGPNLDRSSHRSSLNDDLVDAFNPFRFWNTLDGIISLKEFVSLCWLIIVWTVIIIDMFIRMRLERSKYTNDFRKQNKMKREVEESLKGAASHGPSYTALAKDKSIRIVEMLLIGLTGSIATGKSTVSQLLSQTPYNLPIIDADLLARKVVEPGTPGYNKIVSYFGPTTPDLLLPSPSDGQGRPLNRPVLGRRVFGDTPEKKKDRQVLNGIVHPAVRWEMYKALAYYYVRGHWAVVLDVPLLFEAGLDAICGTVMVVSVSDPEMQLKWLRQRDTHLSEEDARNRIQSQGDVREKARRAEQRGKGRGVVVTNDDGMDDLKAELARAMKEVKSTSPTWWAWCLVLMPPLAGLVGLWNIWESIGASRKWKQQKHKSS
ncbi:CoaE-domain-containing protein [Xylona heveae TC161]|uniref:CoaE-domain-containing protein n=1 Tax=Xylona heveae (strain CBS 132557 / TC161) TaxID=1328760 RepID=A0A165IZ62_XYLHT|nr:CoaE-domain-containing protein [Xylona heveae TC161]KZF25575.1 CoaE-domain-containing protein [Xylona heveae TC161]